jgi:hypothetical protein
VSSLRPHVSVGSEDNSQLVKFYLKESPSKLSPTGDLVVKITPQFVDKGRLTTFTTPTTLTDSYTAGRALADVSYDAPSGKFTKTVTPVVSELVGLGGLSVSEIDPGSGDGRYSVSYLADGAYGAIDSMEPINSRLEFRGVHSYIKLPFSNPVTIPYGLIGKILLPKKTINNVPLKLVLQVFGNLDCLASSVDRGITFNLEYSVSTAQNSAAPVDLKNRNKYISPLAQGTARTTINISAAGTTYEAYSAVNLDGALVIPSEYIGEDSVVNFKLLRSFSANSNYVGDIGVTAIYWAITS